MEGTQTVRSTNYVNIPGPFFAQKSHQHVSHEGAQGLKMLVRVAFRICCVPLLLKHSGNQDQPFCLGVKRRIIPRGSKKWYQMLGITVHPKHVSSRSSCHTDTVGQPPALHSCSVNCNACNSMGINGSAGREWQDAAKKALPHAHAAPGMSLCAVSTQQLSCVKRTQRKQRWILLSPP